MKQDESEVLWCWWTPILFLPSCNPQVHPWGDWHDLTLDHATASSSSLILPQLFFLDRTWDIDLLIYISDISPFSRQSLLTILLFIVLSISEPSTYSNLGTFLVHLLIVLSLKKAPIGLVYKTAHVSPFSLASSVLYLLSNLVSSLGLPVWLKYHKLLITRLPSKKTTLWTCRST